MRIGKLENAKKRRLAFHDASKCLRSCVAELVGCIKLLPVRPLFSDEFSGSAIPSRHIAAKPGLDRVVVPGMRHFYRSISNYRKSSSCRKQPFLHRNAESI